jgi:uncharacterized protein YlaI
MMCDKVSFQDGKGVMKEVVEIEPSGKHIRNELIVVLMCPRCHQRISVLYDEWCVSKLPKTSIAKKYLCSSMLCENTELIYHKMRNE